MPRRALSERRSRTASTAELARAEAQEQLRPAQQPAPAARRSTGNIVGDPRLRRPVRRLRDRREERHHRRARDVSGDRRRADGLSSTVVLEHRLRPALPARLGRQARVAAQGDAEQVGVAVADLRLRHRRPEPRDHDRPDHGDGQRDARRAATFGWVPYTTTVFLTPDATATPTHVTATLDVQSDLAGKQDQRRDPRGHASTPARTSTTAARSASSCRTRRRARTAASRRPTSPAPPSRS